MNSLQKTLAIIAFLILAPQTVRHVHVLWFEPRGSVLDKYDQPLKDKIAGAASIDELLRRYDEVRKEVDLAKQEQAKTGKALSDNEKAELEPYKSENMLREAITTWEDESKQIRELRFFWFAGLGFFVLGSLTYKRLSRWSGLALLIAGFSEMIYWTSPDFVMSHTREFDRLLVNKLAFSAVSLVLLIAVIWLQHIFDDKGEQFSPPGTWPK